MSTTSSLNAAAPRSTGGRFIEDLYQVGLGIGTGALAAYMFKIISPVGGAIFGATSTLTAALATAIANQFCADMNQTAFKVGVSIATLIASIGIGALATTAAGFPLTIPGAIGMVLATVVASIAAKILIYGAGCFLSCVAGGCLAAREHVHPH